MGAEVTQVLQGRFRTIDGPTIFLKIDTEGDKIRCARCHPEVVAAARNEGPVAAASLRMGGDACQLPTV